MSSPTATSAAASARNLFLEKQLQKVLRDLKQELLPEDRLVAGEFVHTEGHVTVEQLRDLLAAKGHDLDISFVRRTMRLLCDLGIAQQIHLDDRLVYEHLHLNQHHDHMVCVCCGAIEEFENNAIEEQQWHACQQAGFKPLMHQLIIRGICAACARKMPRTRLLSSCLPGESVEIYQLVGGDGMTQRLQAMGLVRGSVVRILSADGPLALEVRGSRVALGRQQASRVIVK